MKAKKTQNLQLARWNARGADDIAPGRVWWPKDEESLCARFSWSLSPKAE